ncbi:MAG TPA: penicillin acylase family protein [Thermoanaerobaculia bacterium]|jgi:penicillin amidase
MIKRLALLLIAVLAAVGIGGWVYVRRSIAPDRGTIRTQVRAPVEITYDAKGVPQIWAETEGDAYFAMGWLHASDRLFQMELVRRLANGELSEVFGAAAFDTDLAQRRLGFARRAKRDAGALRKEALAPMLRYVDGVNAYIEQRTLAPEFAILRLRPRRWTVEDCLAISGYQTYFSHELMDQDRKYQALVAKLGAPAALLTHAGHPWSPPTVPDAFANDILGATKLRATAASNSWVVAPSRSASGRALHASDPHLGIDQAPGLWYLAGIHAPGLDVVGVTYAGGPFVVMGHNREIAFSFTVASVDLNDYFDDRARTTLREEIRVKGESRPRVVEIRFGARGVMLDETTSLHWAGFDFSTADIGWAAYRLQRASTFEEFRRAVTSFGALDANWIYSDRDGNIGYQLGAPIPIRDYDSYARQRAEDPRAVWRGYRALDETPHALNPAEGFVASSNNQIVGPRWPYAIPGFYDPYRIVRARELLAQKHSRDDMHAMQLDLVSGIATRWAPLAAEGARVAGLAGAERVLRTWDRRMNAESREAALFEVWWRELARETFEDELGAQWNDGRVLLDEALTTNANVVDDVRTPSRETTSELSARAMRAAVKIASNRTWGEMSTLLVRHPLSQVKLFRWMNRGPLPAPGDAGTLNASFTSFDDAAGKFRSRVGPSMRFVLDWSNVDGFTLTGALGQSGNPFSPHYDDFLEDMRNGKEWIVPFSRAAVFARKASVLRLEPGVGDGG